MSIYPRNIYHVFWISTSRCDHLKDYNLLLWSDKSLYIINYHLRTVNFIYIFGANGTIHHFPYRWLSVGKVYVIIRSLVGCKYRHALRAKHFGSRVFFSLWRLVRPSQDGERTVPLANMLFGAKHANIAQHMRRLDCRVHEETPRPLKLTHGRSIRLWS